MRRNADDSIRGLARRIYEGDTSLIPVLARLYERMSLHPDEDANEVWLVERWGNAREEADRWVLANYQDATAFVAVLMRDEMTNEIEEMDSIQGWASPGRERAWKQGRLRADLAYDDGNYVGVIEAFEAIGTDLIHFARNGVPFVSSP